APCGELRERGEQVIAAPELQPLLLAVGQVAEEKTPERPGPPAVPLDGAGAREEARPGEPAGEVVPAVGREGQVEVVGLPLQAVEADGVAAHDEAAEADAFQGRDDGGEPFPGVQSTASSHPRLPCERSICMSGWRPSSSSERSL